jgi:ADP-ribose pyrophosphatase YjhB (NUDIX family)
MSLSADELAARYDDPYRKADRFELEPDRFDRGLARGDAGAWGVGALVVHDGRGLFVREGDTWLLPGGRLEADESHAAGARREVAEETGLEIEIDGLAAIAEQTFVRRGSSESYEFRFATFVAEPIDATPELPHDPDDDAIEEVRWHASVPAKTFDRDLVERLVDAHV